MLAVRTERRIAKMPPQRARLMIAAQGLTIVFFSFELQRKFGPGRDITRYIDDALISNVLETGNEELVPAFGNLDLRHSPLVGERPVGMQKDMGALDGYLLFAVECFHRHFMIGRTGDLDREGEQAGRMGDA